MFTCQICTTFDAIIALLLFLIYIKEVENYSFDRGGSILRLLPIHKCQPVINKDGEVIAVVYATTKIVHEGKRMKVGLAIPIANVQKYLNTN